jgi:hypothetical protein
MKQRTHIYYTQAQKAEMWNRWERGESLNAIGRVFARPSSSIFNVLSPSGEFGSGVARASQRFSA